MSQQGRLGERWTSKPAGKWQALISAPVTTTIVFSKRLVAAATSHHKFKT